MRRSYLHLLGGVLFSLPLLFTSCGNGDNALEEIINGGGSGGSGEGGGSSTINATAITLSQTLKVMKLGGEALTITVTFTPSDATDKTVTWESSDEAVATVENGVVTAKTNGIAKITAKSGELTATCKVFVGNEVTLGSANYTANNYDILKGNMGDFNLTIPDGFHVAFDGLNTNNNIKCDGDATFYLIDGKTNTVTAPDNYAGIQIGPSGKTLTINAETDGTGTLTVQGGQYAAGIGTSRAANPCGAITINGGTVNATGGQYGAGIGTGGADYYDKTCGDITISGGTVNATGGEDAAGIGTGGVYQGHNNECGAITIKGGEVTANGGNHAVGIGTGHANSNVGSASQTCGAIMIDSDVTSVTAKRGANASYVIGVGFLEGSGSSGNCGAIKFGTATVFDGTVDTGGTNSWDANIIFYINGDYGPFDGLKLTISETSNTTDTWTLKPIAP